MIKKHYISFLFIITICNACSLEQELIISKSKKKYVSEQQDLEMDGNIVTIGTDLTCCLIDLLKSVSVCTKDSLSRINDHLDGKKNAIDKIERTEQYAKKMKLNNELARIFVEIEKIRQRLENLIVSSD